ncbi:MAG: class I SAM-dependent methyltransferase [Planctomycetes bacterium]|nr:class I SAM-dependent methyltransferase [Planctomycetota bacterium]
MPAARAIRIASLPGRLGDRIRWELREWRRPSRLRFNMRSLTTPCSIWCRGNAASGFSTSAARGQYIQAARAAAADVHGLDISRPLLLQARPTGRPLVAASGERLPYRDGSFDTVLVHKTMYCFASPPDALAGIQRVLRPGGRLVFSTSRIISPNALVQAAAVRCLGRSRWDWGNRLGPSAWMRMAAGYGFGDARVYSCNLAGAAGFSGFAIRGSCQTSGCAVLRAVRRVLRVPMEGSTPHALAQDFVIVLRKR